MRIWANDVRSGDPDNLEARAAAFYWKTLFMTLKILQETEMAYPLIIF